jgi:hypothetical protein
MLATYCIYILTTCCVRSTKIPSLAHRGASSGGDPEGGARRGVLRRRLVTVASGGPGPRPPGTTTWLRGARCDRSGANAGESSAAPEPKTATVERREASVPRYGTQGASLGDWRAALRARPTGALAQHPNVSRRSAHPSSRVSEAKGKARAQKKRAAGTRRAV